MHTVQAFAQYHNMARYQMYARLTMMHARLTMMYARLSLFDTVCCMGELGVVSLPGITVDPSGCSYTHCVLLSA